MWLHACSSIMVDGTLFFLPPLLIITLFSFFNLRFVGRKFKEKKKLHARRERYYKD
jgi:preprotein translocase subunit YajC